MSRKTSVATRRRCAPSICTDGERRSVLRNYGAKDLQSRAYKRALYASTSWFLYSFA